MTSSSAGTQLRADLHTTTTAAVQPMYRRPQNSHAVKNTPNNTGTCAGGCALITDKCDRDLPDLALIAALENLRPCLGYPKHKTTQNPASLYIQSTLQSWEKINIEESLFAFNCLSSQPLIHTASRLNVCDSKILLRVPNTNGNQSYIVNQDAIHKKNPQTKHKNKPTM